MKFARIWLLTTGCVGAIAIPPAWADATNAVDKANPESEPSAVTGYSPPDPELESAALTVDEWLAQVEATETAIITDVQINPTSEGLSITLISDQPLAAGDSRVAGNALITDIPNATLNLTTEAAAEQFGPAEGIALVSVTELPDGGVQISVTGTDAPPEVQIDIAAGNLVLSVAPGVALAGGEDDAIRIGVTGEDDEGYNPSSASVGTGTDTPLLDIPAVVQVIPEAVIEDQRAFDLLDVLRNTPGITTGTSPRDIFNGFTIRGFATGNTFLRNGVADNDLGRSGFDLTNVERVEVLRGPASILYGQIAPGGAVNIVTKRPLPYEYYDVEATYGSFNTYEGAVDLSGPLTEDGSVSYRLNAAIFGSDTFIDEIDIDRYLVAPVITWNISDDTDLTFEAEYLDAQYPNERGLPIEGTILPNPNGDIPISTFLGEPSFDRNDRRTLRLGYDLEHRFSEDWRLRNTFGFTWEENFQDSVGSFGLEADLRTLNRRAFVRSDFDAPNFSRNDYVATLSAIGNFETGGIDHELVIGTEYQYGIGRGPLYTRREIGTIDIFDPVYNQPLGPIIGENSPYRETASNIGVYVQDQLTFSDQFILLVGGRFDFVDYDYEEEEFEFSQNDTAFSPRIGLVYQPAENISLYGSFSQSFEQTLFASSVDNTPFEPQRGTQYEIGVKADWLEGALSTTLALYHLTRTNVVTDDLDNPGFSIQTGEQQSQGVELNVAGEILPGWNVIAGYAYTDASITEDNTFPVGNSIDNVPEHAASLWTTYTLQEGNLEGLGFGLGLYYVGERPGDLDNTFTIPDYFRTDAAVYYERDQFRAQLNFKNLFDVGYFESANGRNRIFPGAPFEVLATVGWEF